MINSDRETDVAIALLSALAVIREDGGADVALADAGIQLPESGRFEGLSDDLAQAIGRPVVDEAASKALAVGVLAGRLVQRASVRTVHDPTSFVIDRELVVRAAEGQSVLRLPWFEDSLFVGRQLPEITAMPARIRALWTDTDRAALDGEPGRFSFWSYGHAYSVDAVPVHGDNAGIEAVLTIATPASSFTTAATSYEKMATRLERSAVVAKERAELHRHAGRSAAEAPERAVARRAGRAADRARTSARLLRQRDTADLPAGPPPITERETEVLSLASHGLTYADIAGVLGVATATVKTHLENSYAKLGVNDKASAVAAALRHGIIE